MKKFVLVTGIGLLGLLALGGVVAVLAVVTIDADEEMATLTQAHEELHESLSQCGDDDSCMLAAVNFERDAKPTLTSLQLATLFGRNAHVTPELQKLVVQGTLSACGIDGAPRRPNVAPEVSKTICRIYQQTYRELRRTAATDEANDRVTSVEPSSG